MTRPLCYKNQSRRWVIRIAVLQGQPGNRDGKISSGLLSHLQGLHQPHQPQQPQFSAAPDPIIDLISSITSSHGPTQNQPPMAPIGSNIRASYQPQHAPYQHQPSHQHMQQRFSNHMVLAVLPALTRIRATHTCDKSKLLWSLLEGWSKTWSISSTRSEERSSERPKIA